MRVFDKTVTWFLFLVAVFFTVYAEKRIEQQKVPSPLIMLDPSKSSWPELVGENGEEARIQLQAALPNKDIFVVPEDAMVTMDYQESRIRLFVDPAGKISRPPRLG